MKKSVNRCSKVLQLNICTLKLSRFVLVGCCRHLVIVFNMDPKPNKEQDFLNMKLSDLLRNDHDDTDSDSEIYAYNPSYENWNDSNCDLPESDIANSNMNYKHEDGAEETNTKPINMCQVFNNYELDELKPLDDKYKNQELKTAFDSEENITGENTYSLVNCTNERFTDKQKRTPKTAAQKSREHRERLKAKREPMTFQNHLQKPQHLELNNVVRDEMLRN